MWKQTLLLLVGAVTVMGHQEGPLLHAVAYIASFNPTQHVFGNITFTQQADGLLVQGTILGLPAGEYGFHVHEKGDITGGCLSTGPHFNPEHKEHGHPEDANRHVGDFGNVKFDANNVSTLHFVDKLATLTGPHGIIGRAVVLHEMMDDYGRSTHPDSKKTGNAGGRVACGVIGIQ